MKFIKYLIKLSLVIFVSISTVAMTFFLFFLSIVIVGLALTTQSVDEVLLTDKTKKIYGNIDSKNLFLSIPVSGLIVGDSYDISDPFGMLSDSLTYGYKIKDKLYEASKQENIKGIILEVHSPGGTIYGSKAIADGIAYYSEKTSKPVIAYIAGLAASGGYWASIGADYVVADYGSVVGSIGVLSGPFKYYDEPIAEDGGLLQGGVVTNSGIEAVMITAGKSKDMGNPYRRLSEFEIDKLQDMVNNQYDDFVEYVSMRRNISEVDIRENIGAFIFEPKTAIDLKLIDAVKSKEDTFQELALQAGITGDDYQIVREEKSQGLMDILLGAAMYNQKQINVSSCSVSKVILAYYGNVAEVCN
ncbi:S49 family peptidase [Patescibacteria group bacterium]